MAEPRAPLMLDDPNHVRRSVLWSGARNWSIRLGAAITFFVLARILPRYELGLFAAAASIMAIADLFAENGLGDAVVQHRRGDDRLYSAAMWFNVLASALVFLALLILAPWLEIWMDARELQPVLSVIAFAVLINALGYIPQAVLRRDMRFASLAARAFAATILSGAVGIALALAGFGVWSMVIQFLVMAVVNAAMVWYARPFRCRLVSPIEAKPLLGFGWRTFANKGLDYLSNRSIEIAIVAASGPVALALWYIASRLWSIAMQLVGAVTMDVALPVFARLNHERDAFIRSYLSSTEVTAAVGVPAFVLLSAVAPEMMTTLFGTIDPLAGHILMGLALLGAMQLLQQYNGVMLSAIGRPDAVLLIMVVRAVTVAVGLAVTFGAPLETVAYTFIAVTMANAPISFFVGRRLVGYTMSSLIRVIAPYILIAAGVWGALLIGRYVVPLPDSPLLRLIVLGTTGAALYCAATLLLLRQRARIVLSHLLGRNIRTDTPHD